MKIKEAKAGMAVAVNDLPDGQIYRIKSVAGFNVKLVYAGADGLERDGGTLDVSCVKKPSKEQLKYNATLVSMRRFMP